ncbi:MAG: hypothetical protein ACI9T8_000486 [Candidatus Saccharimonadales bacterium]|jgi:hypothetical protein
MSKNQNHSTKGLRPPKKHLSKDHAKIYWPYLPLLLVLIGGLFLNVWQPIQGQSSQATLAYATGVSTSGLLSSTNSQRASNGAGALAINSKLNAAAQAKANDMQARDYWAHKTPDGEDPWVFVDAQGYDFNKAGENLAYGYSSSSTTVTGWMNSPSHRANMLDTAFTEVGFGFIDAADFVGNYDADASPPVLTRAGQVTIVVGMYGKPASVQAAVVNPEPEPVVAQASIPVAADPTPEVVEEPEDPIVDLIADNRFNQPVNTDNPVPEVSEATTTSLIQQITNGRAPWSAITLSIIGIGLSGIWVFKHFLLVRKFVIEGEHFVAHHPILDLIVVVIIAGAVYLNQAAGVVL